MYLQDMRKILIWGTGKIAEEYMGHINGGVILGYIVTDKKEKLFHGYPVYMIDQIPSGYDYVILAVSKLYHASVMKQCDAHGKIDRNKICFIKKSEYVTNVNENLKMAKELFDKEGYEDICAEFGFIRHDWISEDAEKWERLNTRESMRIDEKYIIPVYDDKNANAGSINNYFWQDLWAARKIYKSNPKVHYDIGSRIDGFIAHLLVFMKNVAVVDIRPLDRSVDGLDFIQSDATNLDNIADNSIESLSALCSLEHFGLGRYGDEIDPEACYKCFHAIEKKIKNGGDIYIAVPVGKEHIEFNAHRIFYASTIIKEFKGCDLIEYSCVCDGYIEYDVPLDKYDMDSQPGDHRFGLFHLRKRIP